MDFFTRIYVIKDAYVKWMKKVCGCILVCVDYGLDNSVYMLSQLIDCELRDDQSLAIGEYLLTSLFSFLLISVRVNPLKTSPYYKLGTKVGRTG